MFSMTGYFFAGSKLVGRMMMPQISVLPSRAFDVKTSGAFQPVANRLIADAAQLAHRRLIHARIRVDVVLLFGRPLVERW
jgi:hypothetical protein